MFVCSDLRYVYTTLTCASSVKVRFDPTFSAWISFAPAGSLTLVFRI